MSSNGSHRIALCTQGTRGDFQPFIALALRLVKEGFVIKLFGDLGAAKACTEFGLDAVQISAEIKDLLSSKKGQKACISGDLMDIAAADDSDEEGEKDDTNWQEIMDREMTEFNPTLIIWSALIGELVTNWTAKTHVPDIFVSLQPQTFPTNDLIPIPFQRVKKFLDSGTPNIFLWVIQLQALADPYFQAADICRMMNPPNLHEMVMSMAPACLQTPEQVYDGLFAPEKGMKLSLCAFSTSFWPAPADWPGGGVRPGQGGIEVVGRWNIDKDQQDAISQKGGSFFASGSHEETLQFFASGDRPVYMGWGSMIVYSKEHMTALAVGALKRAGKRGIILGGWAGLSPECLDGAPDAEALREYCGGGRVLFLKSAPHEWLFPQCQAAVHHGGIGTTQASLAAGCPTVITPVFADQHDIAALVKKRKIGAATGLFSQTSVDELAAAIQSCCDDPAVKANVSKLAEDMAKEDGISRTLDIIDRFLKEEVATGKWEERRLAVEKDLLARRKKNEKLQKGALYSRWSSEIAARFPALRQYQESQLRLMTEYNELLGKGMLWGVVAPSCLVRAAESIRSAEAGRFQQWAVLEQVTEGKNGRLRMNRREGGGVDDGWVSPSTKDKEILRKVTKMEELARVRELQFENLYSNLRPKEKKEKS
mmetsp:Transcript_88410/g.234809  ORF Transcript_88410/g.234809 Transcript_88410/m.234809 type:complete len:652 (-) Transcript_88410:151-2106(-)|eukprot:CAMPEP_0171183478 /NCGR_PEP_ID=MMETSP0790-20130122/15299_1 /TAXON_ID=2925 /ORGANISM="Alexandrium catenella, Strain OF101" /LENGTH=651 /DNA_ID=CAMNT_0011648455 /DNA_START=54 /DNA_END=2009 /DNA_ORIENTATION=-